MVLTQQRLKHAAIALLLLTGCSHNPTTPPCGYRYTAFSWDSSTTTPYRLTPTDSIRTCWP